MNVLGDTLTASFTLLQQVPGPACPVPCCRESRALVLHTTNTSVQDRDALQEEIGRYLGVLSPIASRTMHRVRSHVL